MSKHQSQNGISLVEFSVLAGLLVLTALITLQLLGVSISNMLVSMGPELKSRSTLSLLDSKYPGQPASLYGQTLQSGVVAEHIKGSGYYALEANPQTGQPALRLVDSSSTEVKNATSLEGNQMNTLGTFMLARTLDALAGQQTQPELQDYYSKMAKLAYYMGANEGEIDDVSGLSQGTAYSNGDALNDLMSTQRALNDMLQNPPAGLNPQAHAALLPLAVDAFNIAQNYVNHLETFIDANGSVPKNFSTLNPDTNKRIAGPGIALAEKTELAISTDPRIRGVTYEKLVPYENLKQTVEALLTQQGLTQPVQITLENAQALDTDPQ